MKHTKDFIVPHKSKFNLKARASSHKGNMEEPEAVAALKEVKANLSVLQEKLYASGSQSLLLIFQAMDGGGKDSIIDHVLSGINPQGCMVHSFKTPSTEEYNHDFLWRHNKQLPGRGIIGVHNRSHYENVLVCKVHPEYVLKERIPGITTVDDIDNRFWKDRYESIRNFETHLTNNGTIVLKFFLNISKEEQKDRFLKRIDHPEKNWKFLTADLDERALWSKYMDAYEEAIAATSTKAAPWYIIPADQKWYARLVVAKIIEAQLIDLKLKFPVSKSNTKTLQLAKERLLKEK